MYFYPMQKIYFLIWALLLATTSQSQVIGLLKYDGGGDWYANPTALKNLTNFCIDELEMPVVLHESEVEPIDLDKSAISFLHATGHGRIYFEPSEVNAIRNFLERGGFLHIDDNYGMAEFAKAELLKIFPNQTPQQLPTDHPIFSGPFSFPDGLPKIHEHDNAPPSALGYFIEDELVCVLTIETDLGDGWEDPEVHNDQQEVRENALKMGANLVHWALTRNSQP